MFREKRKDGTIRITGGALQSWPVNSVYISFANTNPSTIFGGVWIACGMGQVLVGVDPAQTEFDAVEKTGGAKTHTLTEAQMPGHTHTNNHDHSNATTSQDNHNHEMNRKTAAGVSSGVARGSAGDEPDDGTAFDAHSHTVNIPSYSGSTGSKGSDSAHNNLQPFITCYMWRRTA